jgi:hypothetical protein
MILSENSKMEDDTYLTGDNSPRAHRLVARVAKEFTAEMYDIYARKVPTFRELWPSENEFVRQHWHYFIQEARTRLTQLLTTNLDQKLKDEIHDALVRDYSLAPHRRNLPQVKMDI